MTVLVTGGAGFIGSHVVERLVHEGAAVRVLDDLSTGSLDHLAAVRPHVEFIQGSVTEPATVRQAMAGISHVVHEAAIRSIPRSLDDPGLCNRVNVEGTLHVLLAARDAGVRRVVVASSSAVYGDADRYPVREDDPVRPGSPYAVSKAAAELYVQLFRHLYGLDVVCLRYFNVFGPRMDAESGYAMAVPRFVATMLRDEPAPVNGDGLQSRDFIYVENIAQATVCALVAANHGVWVYNIGCGCDHSLLQLVETLNRLMHKRLAPQHLPGKPGESRRTLADITRAREILGFIPAISFEEGLSRTIAWFHDRQTMVLNQRGVA